MKSWQKLANWVWHSPILTSWGNWGVRLLGFAVVLPLALTRLTVEDTSVWLLFQAILSFYLLIDIGFTPTFVRFVSYVNHGKQPQESKPELEAQPSAATKDSPAANNSPAANDRVLRGYSMSDVLATMRFVYLRLSLLGLLLLATLGSLALYQPIEKTPNTTAAWLAWLVIVISSYVVFRCGRYAAYLQGVEKIALYQRWQIFTNLIGLGLSIAVMLADLGLLALVVSSQLGSLAGILVVRHISLKDFPQHYFARKKQYSPELLKQAWSAAWRSGLGILIYTGTLQGSGIIYAQLASAAEVSAYLLALRIAQTVANFSYVPFYTKIPVMARMYAGGERMQLVQVARQGMLRTNWVLTSALIFFGFATPYLLSIIHSETPFVASLVWWILAAAILGERIGAQFLQLYSISNHILWHIANGISGALMLIAMPLFYYLWGIAGLPLGMLFAVAVYYLPYSYRHARKEYSLKFTATDFLVNVAPFGVLLGISLLQHLS